jgi:ribonuclease P protein component
MIMGFGPGWRPKAVEESWRAVALSVEPSFVLQFQPRNENLIRRELASESDKAPESTSKSLHIKTLQSKTLSMSRSLSLKDRESIRKLFRSAKRRSGSSLTVFYRICPSGAGSVGYADGGKKARENHPARWLVAIPKRTGNAVRRNKIRRALRETIRLWDSRDRVAGEIIIRYNPPRLGSQKGSVKKTLAVLDKRVLGILREELIELLEDVYSRVKS